MVLRCEWLSDYLQFKNGKKRPSGKGTYPVYGGNGILDYADEYNQEQGIIIGRVGAYCGSVFYEPNKHWVSDNAISASNNENSDLVFAYYLLNSLQLNKRHIGTSQPLLTQEILNSIKVTMPPLETQRIIAATLSALDDKIANNTAINHHLEQVAQVIFKSWFVDFEPFGGERPDDWREGTLSEICSYGSERIAVSELTSRTYISTENMVSNRGGFLDAASLPTTALTPMFRPGNVLVSNIRP